MAMAQSDSQEDWTGFHYLPAPTQTALHGLLGKLHNQNVGNMTILLLGRGGVGKSSIINSLFGERVAAVSAFQSETLRPCLYSRSKDGFTINIIDTPGLTGAGGVDEEALAIIRRYLVGKTIDAVLYVERLDGPREDQLHKKLIRAISQAFGRQVWHLVIILFTHAQIHPEDVSYPSFVSTRSAALQSAILKEACFKRTNINVPFVLVENGSCCRVNADHEKILPDGRVWLPLLFEALVELISGPNESMVVDEKLLGTGEGKQLGNIWMPIALLAQFFFIWRPIRKAIERDLSEETQQLFSRGLQAGQPHRD
ncbi:hypothetical protein KC19_12G042200 [Ceratodon purpureus]|uniref:AIG1-type G domain-containing protein n=1 Tax=Ceratodon purpureus TaxID=3225 RepID=A0A8T0G703_CERPU|nr:hypothetical protein KC19_12G042200 [Ceratodon purpureus]